MKRDFGLRVKNKKHWGYTVVWDPVLCSIKLDGSPFSQTPLHVLIFRRLELGTFTSSEESCNETKKESQLQFLSYKKISLL